MKNKQLEDAHTAALLFKEEAEKAGLDQYIVIALQTPASLEAPQETAVYSFGSFNAAGLGNLIAGVLAQCPAEMVGKVFHTLLTHPAIQGKGIVTRGDAQPKPKPPEYMN